MTALLALAVLMQSSSGSEPAIHSSRVVLRTSKGDLTLVLYPEVAPRHVRHFLHLVRSGYYEGTRFSYVIPGYLIQHAGYVDRLRPFTPEQEQLGRITIPREFGSLRHTKGVLSMGRNPDDPDSATTVFLIMLGDYPQRDGAYTIFGRVEKGMEVLDALAAVEIVGDKPRHPLNLHHAFIEGAEPGERPDWSPPRELLLVSAASIVGGFLVFLMAGRKLPRSAGPMGLSAVLVGAFIGLVSATPRVIESGENRSILALAIFVGLLSLFKLMNRFESPRP